LNWRGTAKRTGRTAAEVCAQKRFAGVSRDWVVSHAVGLALKRRVLGAATVQLIDPSGTRRSSSIVGDNIAHKKN